MVVPRLSDIQLWHQVRMSVMDTLGLGQSVALNAEINTDFVASCETVS